MFDLLGAFMLFVLMHILCDFYLQPKAWVQTKQQHGYRSREIYLHSLLHGVALLLPVALLGLEWQLAAYLLAVVAISHFVIDLWKVTTAKGEKLSQQRCIAWYLTVAF